MKLKVAIGLMSIFLLTGCGSTYSSDYKGETRYFKTISDELYGDIVYDTRTGVEYWQSHGSSYALTDWLTQMESRLFMTVARNEDS